MNSLDVWAKVLGACVPVFTQPGCVLFHTLVTVWVLCPGRRTVTRMIGVADPEGAHAHDAYHRFLRVGAWTMGELWRILVGLLIARLAPVGAVGVDLDDTLFQGAPVDGRTCPSTITPALSHFRSNFRTRRSLTRRPITRSSFA
jgi:hypothetical protein